MSIARKYNYTNGSKSNGLYLEQDLDQIIAEVNTANTGVGLNNLALASHKSSITVGEHNSYAIKMFDNTNLQETINNIRDVFNTHKLSTDHDSRYYTKEELATYLQGGDTSICVEVFTIVNSNNGDSTFTYNDGTQNIVGTLTAEGSQVFTLQKGTYLPSSNRIEAIINDTLHRSVASGGLTELSETQIALTSPEGNGAEITFKYYVRISLTGEQTVRYSAIQPPQTSDRNIMWFKLLE